MSHYHKSERGVPVSSLGYSDKERDALRIARHFFHSFCEPAREGWIAAFSHALRVKGSEAGPHFALSTLNAIQAVRRARQSAFRFNCSSCRDCALYLSGNERSYMNALRAARRGDRDALEAHLWLLCEGNEAPDAADAFRALADVMDGKTSVPAE